LLQPFPKRGGEKRGLDLGGGLGGFPLPYYAREKYVINLSV
jgi:hypothetical protein